MRENIKILTENCCDRLLGFEADQLLREEYFKDQFEPLHLEILNTPTQYKIDNTIELDPENDFKSSRIIFDELGNLIQSELSKPPPHAGYTLIVYNGPHRPVFFGIHSHRTEFDQAEQPAVLADSFLRVKHGASRIQFDSHRNE